MCQSRLIQTYSRVLKVRRNQSTVYLPLNNQTTHDCTLFRTHACSLSYLINLFRFVSQIINTYIAIDNQRNETKSIFLFNNWHVLCVSPGN